MVNSKVLENRAGGQDKFALIFKLTIIDSILKVYISTQILNEM